MVLKNVQFNCNKYKNNLKQSAEKQFKKKSGTPFFVFKVGRQFKDLILL